MMTRSAVTAAIIHRGVSDRFHVSVEIRFQRSWATTSRGRSSSSGERARYGGTVRRRMESAAL